MDMFKKLKAYLVRFSYGITWSSMTKLMALIAATVYLFCMVVWPILHYRDWVEIQSVWDRWQAFNVGALAFTASVLAWYTAHYRSRENDKKDYQAARVFLVFVASELGREFEKSGGLLKERLKSPRWDAISTEKLGFPQHLNPYFERYIKYAPPENAQYIIDLIKDFQVFTARFNDVFSDLRCRVEPKKYVISAAGDLLNVFAKANRLYSYGRGAENLDISEISEEEIKTGFSQLKFFLVPNSEYFNERFFKKHAGHLLF